MVGNKYQEQIHPRQYSRNQLAYSNLTNHYECKYTIYQLFVLLYKTIFKNKFYYIYFWKYPFKSEKIWSYEIKQGKI